MTSEALSSALHENYPQYQEQALTKRRFGHTTLVNLIQELQQSALFDISLACKSTEGRDIFLVKCGTGACKILLWSQMHGDEATATMALFDLFNFLKASNDAFDDLRKDLLEKCTFYVVPMLNPDGAEAWSRYTSLGIDMNRDALALQSPESRLLKSLVMDLKPDFGFNLHDQGRRYSAGMTGNLATVSFLATAYNEAQEINETRKRAMQLIVLMNRGLQQFIPNSVGKWPADFEPRAFGDNVQKWGTSLILVESGGYKNDPEKLYIRQLNFVAILTALHAIASDTYQHEDISEYDSIPVNSKAIFDLIIRNVNLQKGDTCVNVDVAINREESPIKDSDGFKESSCIEEIGDMSIFFGTNEIDASGLTISPQENIRLNAKATFDLVKENKRIYSIENGKIIER